MRETIRLDRPRKDGTTLRDHLLAVEEASGEELFDEPEVPSAAEHLWLWFWDLNGSIGNNGFGATPLTYNEIGHWAKLYHIVPSPWEVQTLRRMDATFRDVVAVRGAPGQAATGKKDENGTL